MSNFKVQLGNTTTSFISIAWHRTSVPPSSWFNTSFLQPLYGRYVRLVRVAGFRQDAISLCDVKIYGGDDEVETTSIMQYSFEMSTNQIHTLSTNQIHTTSTSQVDSSSTNQNVSFSTNRIDFFLTNQTHLSSILISILATSPPNNSYIPFLHLKSIFNLLS